MVATSAQMRGEYRLEAVHARGGMGVIWRATRASSGETFALKQLLLPGGAAGDERERQRFLREIDLLRQLQCRHVVRYVDSGFDEQGQPYLVTEWLDGEDLAAWMHRVGRDGATLGTIEQFARQALEGLRVCHEAGVVHRDLKPQNIFLAREGGELCVKLIDFGLARVAAHSVTLTRTGQVMGSAHFMAPEQARGSGQLGPRADVFSMGSVLYQLACGRLPFPGRHPVAVLLKVVTETPPRPRSLRPDLPARIDDVIVQAMQKRPGERYASAAQMLEALGGSAEPAGVAISRSSVAGAEVRESISEVRQVSLVCFREQARDERRRRAARALIEAQGGVAHALRGGALVGLFGLELSLGDECERALRVGLALRDGAASVLAATVRVEVGDGLALSTDDLERTLRALEALQPGALYADRATRQLAGDRVRLRSADGDLFVVDELRSGPVRRRVLGVDTPTVGREVELDALRAAFKRAEREAQCEVVLVSGVEGVGKSRLLGELLDELRQRSVLSLMARVRATSTGPPYAVLGDALAAELSRVGLSLSAWVGERLARDTASEGELANVVRFIGESMVEAAEVDEPLRVARADPKVMRQRVLDAFTAVLGAADTAPTVLCIEDLHWADDATLTFVQALVERLEDAPFVLLASASPDLLVRHPELFVDVQATRVELRPLGRRYLRRLLSALLGAEVMADVEAVIAKWSEGNPYLVEELIAWFVSTGVLRQTAGGWVLDGPVSQDALPVGAEALVQARLDRLPTALKRLLQGASVFGERFFSGGLQAAGDDDLPAALRQLERLDLIVACEESEIAGVAQWEFRHPLQRRVAYHMLPEDRRVALHLAAARWLEQIGGLDDAQLAAHYARGGDVERAGAYHASAAERALAYGEIDRAIAGFEASLAASGPTALAQRRMGLCRALINAGLHERASEQLSCIEDDRRSVEAVGAAEVAAMRGRLHHYAGRYAQSEQTLRRAVKLHALAGAGDGEFETRLTLFWVIWVQGRYDDAGELATWLSAHARRAGRSEQICAANLAAAYYNVVAGDVARSVALAREAVDHAQQVGHPYREADALLLLAAAQEIVGLYTDASSALGSADELARRLGTVHHRASVATSLGRLALVAGRAEEAERCYRSAARLSRTTGDSRTLAISLAGTARAQLSAIAAADPQSAERARRLFDEALQLVRDAAPPVEAECRLVGALVAEALGDKAGAREHAEAAMALLEQLGTHERYEVEIVLAVYRAREALGDDAAARHALLRGQQLLEARADRIADDELRRCFLEQVPYNAQLVALLDRQADG